MSINFGKFRLLLVNVGNFMSRIEGLKGLQKLVDVCVMIEKCF